MKKVIACIAIIALLVFAADWALLGIKIFGGNYDILTEAYIGAVCFPIFFVCIAVLKLSKNALTAVSLSLLRERIVLIAVRSFERRVAAAVSLRYFEENLLFVALYRLFV